MKIVIPATTPGLGASAIDNIVKHRRRAFPQMTGAPQQPDMQIAKIAGPQLPKFCKAARQFFKIIPVLIGVILLVGFWRERAGCIARGGSVTLHLRKTQKIAMPRQARGGKILG